MGNLLMRMALFLVPCGGGRRWFRRMFSVFEV